MRVKTESLFYESDVKLSIYAIQGKVTQVHLYGTFHTHRQFNVLYRNKRRRKDKDK